MRNRTLPEILKPSVCPSALHSSPSPQDRTALQEFCFPWLLSHLWLWVLHTWNHSVWIFLNLTFLQAVFVGFIHVDIVAVVGIHFHQCVVFHFMIILQFMKPNVLLRDIWTVSSFLLLRSLLPWTLLNSCTFFLELWCKNFSSAHS